MNFFETIIRVARIARTGAIFVVFGTCFVVSIRGAAVASAQTSSRFFGDVSGAVTDSTTHNPLLGVEVVVIQERHVVAGTATDEFGRYILHHLPEGTYEVRVHYIGYQPIAVPLQINSGAENTLRSFALSPAPLALKTITVSGNRTPVAVNTRTGNQMFKQDEYHGAPTNTTSQIIQQSIAGAVRAPTGEVHIRGQHAEYTYYIDGVPVPAGISGSLNELFDPSVVDQIEFQTGSWDAEYGNKNAAVINVATRVPPGPFHLDAAGYAGSFNSNGQTLTGSGHAGEVGVFFSGARQATDMRREPVVLDTLANVARNFHNHGEDLFGFGKLQLVPTGHDLVNLDLNLSRTKFDVPFDSSGGVQLDDHEQDVNGFENLGWRHRSAGEGGASTELFAGLFHRHGSLRYTPGVDDVPQFIFFPDTATPYNVSEDRSFNTTGLKLDYTLRRSEHLQFKGGILASSTRGHENFSTVDAQGNSGPVSDSDLKGSDVGLYAQAAIAPSELWEVRPGIRFDNHDAPFAPNTHQVSPRLRLSFFPNPASTFWVYYGRLFLPTNVEDLRSITSVAQGGVVAQPTLPERDHFYEAGLVHRFPVGVVWKFSAYRKVSSPGIDDNTVPGSAITTSVNIDRVWITGIESVLEVRPTGPFSGYLNLALNHAYGLGPITGGFFPADTPQGHFDLDHDQRLSATGSVNYAANRVYLSLTGTYGSGLTNGADPDSTYGTGLFSFNRSIKVDPSLIVSASAGYTLSVGKTVLRPQLFVENLFDRKYLLKGAFFSGASVGKPRSLQLRVNIGG